MSSSTMAMSSRGALTAAGAGSASWADPVDGEVQAPAAAVSWAAAADRGWVAIHRQLRGSGGIESREGGERGELVFGDTDVVSVGRQDTASGQAVGVREADSVRGEGFVWSGRGTYR